MGATAYECEFRRQLTFARYIIEMRSLTILPIALVGLIASCASPQAEKPKLDVIEFTIQGGMFAWQKKYWRASSDGRLIYSRQIHANNVNKVPSRLEQAEVNISPSEFGRLSTIVTSIGRGGATAKGPCAGTDGPWYTIKLKTSREIWNWPDDGCNTDMIRQIGIAWSESESLAKQWTANRLPKWPSASDR